MRHYAHQIVLTLRHSDQKTVSVEISSLAKKPCCKHKKVHKNFSKGPETMKLRNMILSLKSISAKFHPKTP